MKKFILLSLITLLLSTRALAAVENAQGYTGFSLNYSYQNVNTDVPLIKSAWNSTETKLAHGFNIGVTRQQPIYKWFVFVTGFQYQFTTASENGNDLTGTTFADLGEMSFYNHNLIVPVKLGFSLTFGGKTSLSIYGGPSLNFLVSTQMRYFYNKNNRSATDLVNGNNVTVLNGARTLVRSADYKQMSWFDIPLGVGLQMTYGRFGIRFEYEWGMLDRWQGTGNFKSDQLTAGLVVLM